MDKRIIILGGELAPEGLAILVETGATVVTTAPYITRAEIVDIIRRTSRMPSLSGCSQTPWVRRK